MRLIFMIFMHLKLTYKSDFKVSLLNPSLFNSPKNQYNPCRTFVFQNPLLPCLGNPQTAGVGAKQKSPASN
jgi:hypothetical protein